MNEEFLKKLQELKQQYVNSLPDLLEQIKADTNVLVSSGMNAVDMDEYYRLTHSLTGSGATYGFHEVSDCSRKMENSIKELMEAEPGHHEQLIGDILVFCSLLEQTVNEAANSDVEIEKVTQDNQFKIDPWKILLADDDRFSREQLAMLLESNGHTVIQAVDGLEAIEKFGLEKPDLVIMDAVMPRMNGLDSAKRIKAESEDRFVPIIFLTALEREDDLVECIRCGGDDFIVKPFNRAILLARIFSMQRIQKL
ncbi:MAG: response regulator, partial [Gammaproteobacteria bacterium]|nr:response regulator [Gammaproteobacteria bacterium]